MCQIREITEKELGKCLSIINLGFATVANEFKLTEKNCPKNPSFMKIEILKKLFDEGYLMFTLFADEMLVGYVALSKEEANTFKIHNLVVLPEYRHKGYGKQLLWFCIDKVKALYGKKIIIGIIEENIILKNWYLENGFVHTCTAEIEHLPFSVGFMEMNLD